MGIRTNLYGICKRMKYDVLLINPILARRKKIVSLRKIKTDDHDAEVLAELARDGKGTNWIAQPETI